MGNDFTSQAQATACGMLNDDGVASLRNVLAGCIEAGLTPTKITVDLETGVIAVDFEQPTIN